MRVCFGCLLVCSMALLAAFQSCADLPQSPSPKQAAKENAPKTDFLGDPLPPGAVARLGTTRFQHTSTGAVGIAFSPDGKSILSTLGAERKLWDASTGRLLQSVKEEFRFEPVTPIFSKDGMTAAAVRWQGIVVWNVPTGKQLVELVDPEVPSYLTLSIAFAEQDKSLVAALTDGTVQWWDIASGKKQRSWKPFPTEKQLNKVDRSTSLRGFSRGELSPDATSLAVIGDVPDAPMVVFDVASGKELWRVGGDTFKFEPDGKRILVLHLKKGEVHLHDLATGMVVCQLIFDPKEPAFNLLTKLALSADGKTAAMGNQRKIALWSIADPKRPRLLIVGPEVPGEYVMHITFSPDSKSLVAGSRQRLLLFDVTTGKEQVKYPGHRGPVESVAFTSDGRHLLTGCLKTADSYALELLMWELASWKQTKSSVLDPYGGAYRHVAPDHTLYVDRKSADPSGIYDLLSKERVAKLEITNMPEAIYRGSFFTPSGRFFVLVAARQVPSYQESVFDARTGKLLWSHKGSAYVFSPDDKWVGLIDGLKAEIRETATGKVRGQITEEWTPHPNPPKVLGGGKIGHRPGANPAWAISHNGRFLASWSPHRRDVWIWDLTTGKRRTVLKGSADVEGMPRVELLWSHDGRMLAVTGIANDNSIQLWETASGNLRRTLQGHLAAVLALAWSRDGRYLVSGSADTTALVWDVGAEGDAR